MGRNELLAAMKDRMPERRYIHTIGVADTAIELATRFNLDTKKRKQRGFCMTHANMRTVFG